MENKKLEKVCHRILAMKVGDFELEMGRFCSNKENPNACGTTFCLVGKMAHEDNYPDEFMGWGSFHYTDYSCDLIGSDCAGLWGFLFSDYHWPNDFSHAHKRAQYLLDNNGQVPDDWDYEWGIE